MLDTQTIATVKSTLPAVSKMGPELIGHFYHRMLTQHPELKNVFNMSNQRNGTQREALFNAVCAWAAHLDNPAALSAAVELIAQKHASLDIRPEQYAIVGENLLATIKELMQVDDEVLAAWGRAYQALAAIFIAREEQIYQETEQQAGGWRGTRAFRISDIATENAVVKSFTFAPADGKPVAAFRAGQYLTVHLHSAGMSWQQNRQYSLTHTSNGHTYRIAVKHEPEGIVSSWLHQAAKVGDVVQLTAPHGELCLDVNADTPVALISAGIGVTPVLAMLHALADSHHAAPVTWLYAAERGAEHAFATEARETGARLGDFQSCIWYRLPEAKDAGHFDAEGVMDLARESARLADPRTRFWLCGPAGFMQAIVRQLRDAGVEESRIHYELFGPHQTL